MMISFKTIRGFNLIELMIALVIGLILMAGAYTILISSKRTYNLQSDIARLQENARYALDMMSRDLRMAGYFGCAQDIMVQGPALFSFNGTPRNDIKLAGWEGGGTTPDRIMVAYADTSPYAFSITHCGRVNAQGQITNDQGVPCPLRNEPGFNDGNYKTPLTAGTITLTSLGILNKGERVVAADCGGADVYTPQTISDSSANGTTITLELARSYVNNSRESSTDNFPAVSYGAELRRLVEARYFIANNNLYKQQFSGNTDRDIATSPNANDPLAELIIEGAENLQIRYGVITSTTDGTKDGFPNQHQYQTADQIMNNNNNWQLVDSVQITLLLRTVNERFDMDLDTQEYVIDGADIKFKPNPPDHRYRQIFRTTVMLRNKVTPL